MKSDKILIFEISGEYAHFRKFNTTSSPLTYSIPSRPTIVGLLGAILGIEREYSPNKYPDGVTPVNEVFSKDLSAIAVQIIAPIKKVHMAFNLILTGKSPSSFFNIQSRTQIEFELLKNPCFRIFVKHQDAKIFEELTKRIKERNHYFTPYLGLAQFTASIDFVDVVEASLINSTDTNTHIPIKTAINLSQIAHIEDAILFEDTSGDSTKEAFYATDTIPISMQRDRIVTEYAQVLIERKGEDGKEIKVRTPHYWHINQYGNILFL